MLHCTILCKDIDIIIGFTLTLQVLLYSLLYDANKLMQSFTHCLFILIQNEFVVLLNVILKCATENVNKLYCILLKLFYAHLFFLIRLFLRFGTVLLFTVQLSVFTC